MMHRLISLVTLFLPIEILALTPCPLAIPARQSLKETVVKALDIVLVGDAERRTASQYGAEHSMTAEAVESRYAATGDIDCPGSEAQGQLTVSNGIVTTAAHVFNDKDCKKKVSPNQCTFTVKVGGKSETYEFEKAIGMGINCPLKKPYREGDDWAVIKLKKKVDSRIKPYRIIMTGEFPIESDANVVAVAKSDDWPKGASGLLAKRPRHYGDCRTGWSGPFYATGRIEHDCDITHGASGGSLLTPGANPVLVGIFKGGTDHVPKSCDPKLGKGGHDTYHEHCWANTAIPMTGEFRDALAEAVEQVPPNEPLKMEPDDTPESTSPKVKL